MKVLTIVGARPQFIKAGPVSFALEKAGIDELILHTGQHYDENMSAAIFRDLGLRDPDVNLHVGSGTHGQQTAAMLVGIEEEIRNKTPDIVLIYGDTNSTLAGAIAASKLRVPIAHVEAGLRSFNRSMPEEINRIVADSISDILLTPTSVATSNLISEGVSSKKIFEVGDVMYDATLMALRQVRRNTSIVDSLGLRGIRYVLATIHRAENTDDPTRLQIILESLHWVAKSYPVVLPIHPRTKARLSQVSPSVLQGIHIVPPVSYLEMTDLEASAAVIATDSGGVQKEAFFHKVPCVTLRNETEWVESIELGWNQLANPDDPTEMKRKIMDSIGKRGMMGNPYGDGTAADRIANALREWCEMKTPNR